MIKKRYLAVVAASAALAVLTFGQSTLAADYVMKYGHVGVATKGSDDQEAALWLKDFLETNSHGRIEVQIYPGGQLGNVREEVEAIQLGTLEAAHTSAGGITQFFPEIQVLSIPYLVPDDQIAECLMDSDFSADLRATILKKTGNVLMLAMTNTGGWRNFYSVKKPIHSAADLAGVKMRTINSPLAIEMVKFLGGNATPVAWEELYTALQTGVVEGTKNAAMDVVTTHLDESLKYVTLDKHEYLYGYDWLSYKWLKSLPKDLQTLVLSGMTQAAIIHYQYNKMVDGEYLKQFVEHGGTVYVPTVEEKATFQKAKEPMIKWFIDKYGDTWYKKATDSINKCQAKFAKDYNDILALQ